ncbi:hypothetical protein D8I24_2727 (plasmid) [Cupriavidus necator H850]|nr:hypothetical protein D8I24_2679 [Cupriavidus necator H850]KAI3604091.1 hypothetical protein D8I24_2680 [Cupriavidus necator H850]KAI3604137.1 hypothetical protein D8I24_2726 [Cupriavidus necator H850]KAI3604138.1 hypothetical protein D8I24_2727 [Cupriavidus necator H850]
MFSPNYDPLTGHLAVDVFAPLLCEESPPRCRELHHDPA